MNYKQHHAALLELKEKMDADKLIKTSYHAVFSAIISTVEKAAANEGPMPVLTRLRKETADRAKKEAK